METKVGSKVHNKGLWKRFFYTCKVARIPYLTLLLYIIVTIGQNTLLVMIPQINADFFNGDASVKSVSMFIGAELAIVQVGLYINQLFRLRTDRNLRNVLWGKLLRLKPRYYDRVSANTLLSRITIDTSSLNEFILDVILEIFFNVYVLVLTIKEMSGISIKASFVLLVFVPLSLLISFFMGRLNLKFENAMKFEMSNLTEYLSELVSSIPVVKAFNRQSYESKRGEKVVDDFYRSNRNVIGLDVLRQVIGTAFGILPEIVLIIAGVRLLKDSALTPAGWYTFYVYSGTLLSFVNGMGSLWEMTKSIQGRLNMVSAVLFEEEEGLEPYVNDIVDSGDILFDNVSFSYDEKIVLDGVSFTIPKNKTTAVVGFSGSGKSTVLKLIERVYDPDGGRIMMGGCELKDYDLRAWRGKLAVVSQSAPMISGTVRENVLYGVKGEVSDEEIMEAARLTKSDKFIENFSDGLDHEVGQFGSRLSGGQKQKLSIARAILSKPEVLILDEPTASLDVLSTNEIAEVIRRLNGQMTIILVTHHAAVARSAEHIIVLDKENPAVEGSREELMMTNEFYTSLISEEKEGGQS